MNQPATTQDQIEIDIARALIAAFLSAGYVLGVNDGEETVLRNSTEVEEIIEAMQSTDHDYLLVSEVRQQGGGPSYRQMGWVLLIWGNGHDLISDHNDCFTDLIAPVQDMASRREFMAADFNIAVEGDEEVSQSLKWTSSMLPRAFGDDHCALDAALNDLMKTGRHVYGGGAAPAVIFQVI